MSSQPALYFTDQKVQLPRTCDGEVLDRFNDIRAAMRERHGRDLEVTNELVLSTLCDLYWLHEEGA